MDVKDFYYDLPEELIAQDPLEDRSSSRLLVLNKDTGEIQHKVFRDILSYLRKGDCLVINDTKVIPARLIGSKDQGQNRFRQCNNSRRSAALCILIRRMRRRGVRRGKQSPRWGQRMVIISMGRFHAPA